MEIYNLHQLYSIHFLKKTALIKKKISLHYALSFLISSTIPSIGEFVHRNKEDSSVHVAIS